MLRPSPTRSTAVFHFSHNQKETQSMSKYVFADAEHTIVKCLDDGSTFELPRHVHPSNINGFAAERWRADGCPAPEAYKAPVAPDDQARAQRRAASDDRRNAR